jgi:hypothetical protein
VRSNAEGLHTIKKPRIDWEGSDQKAICISDKETQHFIHREKHTIKLILARNKWIRRRKLKKFTETQCYNYSQTILIKILILMYSQNKKTGILLEGYKWNREVQKVGLNFNVCRRSFMLIV